MLIDRTALIILTFVTACGGAASPSLNGPARATHVQATPPPPAAPAQQNVTLQAVGLDGSKIDRGAAPCDDFYRFACGAWLDRSAAPQLRVDGFNEDQQFFLAVAQAWCTKTTDDFERLRAMVDPHSSPRFRVLGALSNLQEFAEAWQCAPDAKMRPAHTCKVW